MKDLILAEEWGKLLLDKPPIPSKIPDIGPPPGMVKCACAKKFIPFREVKVHDTPHAKGVTDSICDECLKNVAQHALIVCLGCRAIVARVPPSQQPNGFRFEARAKYHIMRCPNCVNPQETLTSSTVIEAEVYAQERGLTTKKIFLGEAKT